MSIKEIHTEEFGHCVLVENNDLQLAVTIDYGPRIVSVTKNGGRNLIYHDNDPEFNRCHGHKMRLTVDRPSNGVYFDDSPVIYSVLEDGVKFVQTVLEPIQLELSLDIMQSNDSSLMIVHSVTNKSKEPLKLSIYTETPLLHDGFVFAPQSEVEETTRPSRILTLWNDTRWTDARLHIGDNYIAVTGSDNCSKLKIGMNNTQGQCMYLNGKNAFVKHYIHNRTALYPFSHCSTYFTAHEHFLSIQTSSPFYLIEPMEIARHIENWSFPDSETAFGADDEEAMENFTKLL